MGAFINALVLFFVLFFFCRCFRLWICVRAFINALILFVFFIIFWCFFSLCSFMVLFIFFLGFGLST